ncbi:MAG: hypothetical protein LBC18_08750 [Opitutaceae bacterium]|jgi:hypothetical protein|nr:hypothetical protein [Opitutaceae bacterium]
MKIIIETESSYEAKVTIDGRKLVFGVKNGGWRYKSGLKEDESENTIGGMIAFKLMDVLPDILQNWITEFEPHGLWEKLPDAVADKIYEKLN